MKWSQRMPLLIGYSTLTLGLSQMLSSTAHDYPRLVNCLEFCNTTNRRGWCSQRNLKGEALMLKSKFRPHQVLKGRNEGHHNLCGKRITRRGIVWSSQWDLKGELWIESEQRTRSMSPRKSTTNINLTSLETLVNYMTSTPIHWRSI